MDGARERFPQERLPTEILDAVVRFVCGVDENEHPEAVAFRAGYLWAEKAQFSLVPQEANRAVILDAAESVLRVGAAAAPQLAGLITAVRGSKFAVKRDGASTASQEFADVLCRPHGLLRWSPDVANLEIDFYFGATFWAIESAVMNDIFFLQARRSAS